MLRCSERGGSFTWSLVGAEMTKPDAGRLVEEAAAAIDLPIADEYRAGVILNIERTLLIVRPLLELELEDGLMSAPVFRP